MEASISIVILVLMLSKCRRYQDDVNGRVYALVHESEIQGKEMGIIDDHKDGYNYKYLE